MHGVSIAIAKRVLDDLKIPYEVRYLGPFPRVMVTAEREAFLLYPKTTALANPVLQGKKHAVVFAPRCCSGLSKTTPTRRADFKHITG